MTNRRLTHYLSVTLAVLLFSVSANAQVSTKKDNQMDKKPTQENVTCIAYQVQGWGNTSTLSITPDTIRYELRPNGERERRYVVKTTEILWYLLLDELDLNAYKTSVGGMTHQIFDGSDEQFSVKTTAGEYMFLNPSTNDSKITRFFELVNVLNKIYGARSEATETD